LYEEDAPSATLLNGSCETKSDARKWFGFNRLISHSESDPMTYRITCGTSAFQHIHSHDCAGEMTV
jgi:hypothetical protein